MVWYKSAFKHKYSRFAYHDDTLDCVYKTTSTCTSYNKKSGFEVLNMTTPDAGLYGSIWNPKNVLAACIQSVMHAFFCPLSWNMIHLSVITIFLTVEATLPPWRKSVALGRHCCCCSVPLFILLLILAWARRSKLNVHIWGDTKYNYYQAFCILHCMKAYS